MLLDLRYGNILHVVWAPIWPPFPSCAAAIRVSLNFGATLKPFLHLLMCIPSSVHTYFDVIETEITSMSSLMGHTAKPYIPDYLHVKNTLQAPRAAERTT